MKTLQTTFVVDSAPGPAGEVVITHAKLGLVAEESAGQALLR